MPPHFSLCVVGNKAVFCLISCLGEGSPGLSMNEGSPRVVARLFCQSTHRAGLARKVRPPPCASGNLTVLPEGLVEVVPRLAWRVACVAEAFPRAAGRDARAFAVWSPPLGGLLVLSRGGAVAFAVTPCNLQAGSVRS